MKSTFLLLFLCCTFASQAKPFAIQRDSIITDSTVQKVETISAEGMVVYFSLDEDINANEITKGSTIDFTVRADVKLNGKILIEKGALAEGEITYIDYDDEKLPSTIKIQLNSVQSAAGYAIPIKSKAEVFKFIYDKEEKAIINKGKNMSGQIRNNNKSTETDKKEQTLTTAPLDAPKINVRLRLYGGTAFEVETTKTYTEKELVMGAKIPLKVIMPVKVNGNIVIPYEAIAAAEIAQITPSAFGKVIELKLLDVIAIDGQKIPLRGTLEYDEKDFLRKIEIRAITRTEAEILISK
jgi:hypothetical protein